MAFSPDSLRLAVGQSDKVVYVYRIGASWWVDSSGYGKLRKGQIFLHRATLPCFSFRSEKKVIVNKMMQTDCVSALDWPFEDKLLIGLCDGKVRIGRIKSNKCSSLYKTDQTVTAMSTKWVWSRKSEHLIHFTHFMIAGSAFSSKKTAFVSGHLDGSIILFNFASKSQVRTVYEVPPLVYVCNSRLLQMWAKTVSAKTVHPFGHSVLRRVHRPRPTCCRIGSTVGFQLSNWVANVCGFPAR